MGKLTADDAFDLASRFHDAAVSLGTYLYSDQGRKLSSGDWRKLEDAQWSLLNASSDIRTSAVGLVLDETQASLAKLQSCTDAAKLAIKKIETAKKAIRITTALVVLGAAVMSKDPGAIASAAKGVLDAVSS